MVSVNQPPPRNNAAERTPAISIFFLCIRRTAIIPRHMKRNTEVPQLAGSDIGHHTTVQLSVCIACAAPVRQCNGETVARVKKARLQWGGQRVEATRNGDSHTTRNHSTGTVARGSVVAALKHRLLAKSRPPRARGST